MTVGKYLAGGMSFGAFGGRRELMADYDPTRPGSLFHAGTFNNNVLSMSAGIAGLGVLADDALPTSTNAATGSAPTSTAQRRTRPVHVSGRGSLMTIHPAAHPIIASAPLTDAQAAVKVLVFFAAASTGASGWPGAGC